MSCTFSHTTLLSYSRFWGNSDKLFIKVQCVGGSVYAWLNLLPWGLNGDIAVYAMSSHNTDTLPFWAERSLRLRRWVAAFGSHRSSLVFWYELVSFQFWVAKSIPETLTSVLLNKNVFLRIFHAVQEGDIFFTHQGEGTNFRSQKASCFYSH